MEKLSWDCNHDCWLAQQFLSQNKEWTLGGRYMIKHNVNNRQWQADKINTANQPPDLPRSNSWLCDYEGVSLEKVGLATCCKGMTAVTFWAGCLRPTVIRVQAQERDPPKDSSQPWLWCCGLCWVSQSDCCDMVRSHDGWPMEHGSCLATFFSWTVALFQAQSTNLAIGPLS